MPDFMRVGGVTGWLRGGAIARTAGVPMYGHLYGGRRPYDASNQTVHWLEWQDWTGAYSAEPYGIKESLLHIPDVRGVALE